MNHQTCSRQGLGDRALDGFLTNIEPLNTGLAAVTAVRCLFNLDRFDPDLYAQAGVVCPPAIAGAVPRRQAEHLAGRWLSQRLWTDRNLVSVQIHTGEHR